MNEDDDDVDLLFSIRKSAFRRQIVSALIHSQLETR